MADIAALTARLDSLESQIKKLTNKVVQLEHDLDYRIEDVECQLSPRSRNSFTGIDYRPPVKLPFPEIEK